LSFDIFNLDRRGTLAQHDAELFMDKPCKSCVITSVAELAGEVVGINGL